MINRLPIASLITLPMMLIISCPVPGLAQAEGPNLANKRITLQVKDATLIYVLGTLAVDKRVPIGFEESNADRREVRLNIDVVDGTLKDVLDAIVNQEPIYTWDSRDGVINLTPIHERDVFLRTLLETPVSCFAPKSTDKFEIRDAILDLDEVATMLAFHKVGIDRFDYVVRRSLFADDKVDLSISNTDVRGVLNKVIKDSEHKLWIVKRVGNTKALRIGF